MTPRDAQLAALLEATEALTAPGAPFELTEPQGPRAVRRFVHRRTSLRDVLAGAADHGDRDCVVFDDGRRLSFVELVRAAAWVAHTLAEEHGIRGGDRVAIAGANSLEWLITFWACQALGAVVVAMNSWWTPTEMANALTVTRPTSILADEKRRARLAGLTDTQVLELEKIEVRTDPGMPLPDAIVSEDDDAVVMFTSGTTGRPKAAVVTHGSVTHQLGTSSFLAARSAVLAGGPSAAPGRPVMLAVMPLFHQSGLGGTAIRGLHNGITTVWAPGRFDPAHVIELTEREGISIWLGASTHIVRLLEHPDLEHLDGTQIQAVGVGGSAVTPELIRRIEERFPHLTGTMGSGYGSTEAGGAATLAPNFLLRDAPACVGPPLPGVDVMIVGDDGQPVPDGVEGEVVVHGPSVMREYLNHPDANAAVFVRDGWVRMGDIGHLRDGLLHLAARRRDLIIRGGENIYPFEVENRLEQHPAVLEAAVYGVDDPVYGQVPHAAVVLRDGRHVTGDELRDHCGQVVSAYKLPASIHILKTPLPRNASGKVMKHVLEGQG